MSEDKKHLVYSAFKHSTDAIILTDLRGLITDVNDAFVEIFGWQRDELIGKTTNVLRSDATSDLFYKKMWESIEKEGHWQGEIINKRKDGNLVPVLLSITPIVHERERIGYMGIEIDLTEKLKKQEQMAHSERLATIGQMASKVAHEVRNPLSSISLNAELLEDELSDPRKMDHAEAVSLLRSIIREVDRLAELTNEYLQFSRLPRSRREANDLGSLLHEVCHFMIHEAENHEVRIHLEKPESKISASFDHSQMHRVMLNLLRNGIEALPDGGRIDVKLEHHPPYAYIHVRDSGKGIPKNFRDKVFQPFFTSKDMGTGLGLAITRQVVREHGGDIILNDSTEGAHFVITLPTNGKSGDENA